MAVAVETQVPVPVRSFDFWQALFYAYVGIALVLFTFLPPPFQKPDEPLHFYRAVSLTNLDFVCKRNQDGDYAFQMKNKYADLPNAVHVWRVALQSDKPKFDPAWLRIDFSDPYFDRQVSVKEICNLAPPGYLPTALGVLIGKPFENSLVSFYLGRVFGAAFFAIVLVWALKVTPEALRPPVYLYAALPMVLHQASSVNYDAVHLSLYPLIYAYLTRFAIQESLIKASELAVFLGALWWATNTRTLSYTPLLLLFFALTPASVARDFRRYLGIAGGFFGVCAISLVLVGILYMPRLGPPELDAHIDAGDQVQYVLENPARFVTATYETLRESGDWLIMEAIGVFGWDDTPLDFLPYFAFIAIGAAVLYDGIERGMRILAPRQVAVILGAVALTVISVFASLYAIWTPVGADAVGGVQGRYLVGLVPLTLFGLAQLVLWLGKRRSLDLAALIFVPVLLYNLYRAIDLRFYG